MKQVALIGYGAIGQVVAKEVAVSAVLVRPARLEQTRKVLPGVEVIISLDDLDSLGNSTPNIDIVVECAGHVAVREYGEQVLARGMDLMVISTGVFADRVLFDHLCQVAARVGSRILLPAGAIAGIDGLLTLRAGGLDSVRYTSSKPPRSWLGTPAQDSFDLEAMTERTVVFSGSAGEAARLFPKNANLALTVALAGLGIDETQAELVADPGLTGNVGRVEAIGRFGKLLIEIASVAAPDNPKTSMTTAYSIVHALRSGNTVMAFP